VFRQDLVAEAIEEQGARYIDVMDPDSGNVFRFFEVEYSIACAMDGQRDVAGIVKWAQEELGLTPSAKEVQTVIATLADLRFISTGATKLSEVPEAKVAAKSAWVDEHNEATVVGAAPLPDEELAPGIVVGAAARTAAAANEVELGHAGGRSAAPREEALPRADFDLGAPGASTSSAKPPRAPVEEIALGASGAKAGAKAPVEDLSMDLSEQMAIKPSDVKEAVRASKVMTAVEVPKELQDELERPAAKPAAAAPKPTPAVAKPAAAAPKPAEKPAEKPAAVVAKPAEKPAEKPAAKPAEKPAAAAAKPAEKTPAKKPVELSKQPPEKTPIAPPAPAARVNPVLVLLLIVAILGAAAFFVWKLVLNKPETEPATQKMPPKPPAPKPPAEVTSKIAFETPPAQDIKSPAGTLESIETNDKDVKTGDVIATLVGAKALATEVGNLQKDADKGTPAVEAAQKELADAQQKPNNQAGVTAAQTKLDKAKKVVDDKKAAIAKKQADLDKLTLKASADGKLATTDKVGQKVVADEVIAKITRATLPVATFKIPPGTKVGADGNISLTAGDKTVVCTVSDAQAETIKVTCPADAGLANGADVKFKLPK
jgi:hypothetical protein